MSVPVNIRASDRTDFLDSNRTDFIVRKRQFSKRLAYSLCAWAVVVILGVVWLVMQNALFGSLMCVVVGSITLALARQIENLQNMLQATEFLNALLSSALGKHYSFDMVAKLDGEIVYVNRPFQEMFPEFLALPARTVGAFLDMCQVPQDRGQTIINQLNQSMDATVTVEMVCGGAQKQTRSVALTIEPIARPSGFVLLRGKL
jgi:hypothetical protein